MREITNNWFTSFPQDKCQYTNIKECSSEKLLITYGVSQGLVLGRLLFLFYINNLQKSMMHCSVHQFADDSNLLLIDKSLKNINKHTNHDLKHLYTESYKSFKLNLKNGFLAQSAR